MLEFEDRPMAFVAMKFEDDHWRDQKYLVIKDELEKCGYQVRRADEINTSSAVVDEVCDLLKNSELVVVDSSGDSHSVSYELGYCHGCDRPSDKTLLIRDNADIPFNYRHFRHRVYKDKRHLRRLIRDYLDLSEPLKDEQYGYVFTFSFSEKAVIGYILEGASYVIQALVDEKFSGRCECYSCEQFAIPGRVFSVGIGIRYPRGSLTPEYEDWSRIAARVELLAKKSDGRVTYDSQSGELAELRAIRHYHLHCGVAEFRGGQIVSSTNSNGDADFFSRYLENKNA